MQPVFVRRIQVNVADSSPLRNSTAPSASPQASEIYEGGIAYGQWERTLSPVGWSGFGKCLDQVRKRLLVNGSHFMCQRLRKSYPQFPVPALFFPWGEEAEVQEQSPSLAGFGAGPQGLHQRCMASAMDSPGALGLSLRMCCGAPPINSTWLSRSMSSLTPAMISAKDTANLTRTRSASTSA